MFCEAVQSVGLPKIGLIEKSVEYGGCRRIARPAITDPSTMPSEIERRRYFFVIQGGM